MTADETIRIDRGGTPLTVASPGRPTTAGLVVVHEAWGVTPYVRWLLSAYATEGYLTVAPHLYHRRGDIAITDDDFSRARPLIASLTGESIAADLSAATGYLREAGMAKIGVVGFCMGGSIALWAAANADVDAAVTYYGGGLATARWSGMDAGLDIAPHIRVPWLGLYGDKDRSIPVADVERLRTIVETVNAPTQIVRYATAGHAFASDPASDRHVREAAEDAGIRTRQFFDTYLHV